MNVSFVIQGVQTCIISPCFLIGYGKKKEIESQRQTERVLETEREKTKEREKRSNHWVGKLRTS